MPEGDARGEQEHLLEAAERFAEPGEAGAEAPRVLLAVLFTDIVGSTQLAAALGDRRWRELVERHHEAVRTQIARHGGRVVDTAGDGFFATFDSPGLAVEAGGEAVRAVRRLGLRIRAGVHFGECIVTGGEVRGVSVHIGARIAAKASGGEVLVSQTVRDLLGGAGVRFVDGGHHALKGVEGRWRLFVVEPPVAEPEADLPPLIEPPKEEVAWWRRRNTIVAAITALAVLIAAVFYVTTRGGGLASVPADSVAAIDAASGDVRSATRVGRRPVGLAIAGGRDLWVANSLDRTVTRVRGNTRENIPLAAGPAAITVTAKPNLVWIASPDDRTISRISPETGREVGTKILAGNGLAGITAGAGFVWVANGVDGTVWQIDPSSGAVKRRVSVGASPRGLAATERSVWVALEGGGSVVEVDAHNGAVARSVNVGNGPAAVAASGRFVWVANALDGTVSRIDVSSGAVTATVAVGAGPRSIAVARGKVFVANERDETVSVIDASSARVVRTIALSNSPMALSAAGDTVWVSVRGGVAAYQGGTLKVGTAFPMRTFDPAFAFNPLTHRITQATHDGLLGFRRAGGVEGSTVAPNLADAMRPPTDDGKTYTYTLRRGLKWSDGKPVRASDVRETFERIFTLDAPAKLFFGVLEGADACRPESACNLSKGIEIDDARGSITFHLTRAIADFPYFLALPPAAVVPGDTPLRDMEFTPIPGTGPYRFGSIEPQPKPAGAPPEDPPPGGSATLERNPNFVERPAQPGGYPDVIAFNWGGAPADHIQAVKDGREDFTPDTEELTPSEIFELEAQYAGRFHAATIPAVRYIVLNLRSPRMKDVRVRRAINFGVDRASLAKINESEVTCQILPPNVVGHAPYCPYTASPGSGLWTGRDLARARRLVAEAKASGLELRIIVHGNPIRRLLANALVPQLREIGFKPVVQVVPDEVDPYDAYILKGAAEVAFEGWVVDYPAASNFFVPLLMCEANARKYTDPVNGSGFCNASIDAKIEEALVLQRSDPAAVADRWAELDRLVTDQAPWVPYGGLRAGYLVSPRVGNVQVHAVSNVLITQLWVR